MDLISIIVPVYNVEVYLEQCISSLICQTYPDYEIILVDDGSPDRCPEMCDRWAEKDHRIRVIHKENGGLSDARNAGLKIANGDYIAFVDSDDWVAGTFLEVLYREIQNTGVDICECAVTYVDENGAALRNRSCEKERVFYSRAEAIKTLIREEGIYQTVWNKLYKRSVVEGIPFEVGKYHEDDFWTYQVFDQIGKMSVINTSLYFYRQRAQSIMGSGYQLKRLDGLEARIRRMEYFRKDADLYDYAKAYLQFDFLYHFQSIQRNLTGTEKTKATQFVLNRINALEGIHYRNTNISLKYRLWFSGFRKQPFIIAGIRNLLKIGI